MILELVDVSKSFKRNKFVTDCKNSAKVQLRLLFSLKPKKMAKMKLLAYG